MIRIFLGILLAIRLSSATSDGTSNYAQRGLDVEYQGNGLPQEATLDGIVTKLDELTHTIITNRTTASLSCASRAMEVDLEFAEPFHGIVYADFSRQSACSFVGNGATKYHYELPLSGCGTVQDPLRVFTNNILVRFHPSLEMVGDEVKTIVCRYPEPVVPPPLGPPLPISVANTPLDPVPQRLAEPQILMIICALLFLAMMLFGVACSYFCLKQRNIHLIRRRRVLSSGFGSEITGMSEQTLFPPFAGLKIPRAHAPSSGSDQQPIVESSETLPSDYPSESRSGSEIEEGDVRSYRQPSSIESVQHREEVPIQQTGYEPELSSVYSDAHNCQDFDEFNLPTAIPRIDPTFDVAFRVKSPPKRSPAPSSVASDDTVASTGNILVAQERALTTILEREEWRQSEVASSAAGQPAECPPLNSPPDCRDPPPPGYAELRRKPRSVLSARSIPENDVYSVTETVDFPDGRHRSPSPARSLESQARSVAETIVKQSRPYVPKPDATFRVTNEIPERHVNEHTLVINEDIQLHTSIERQLNEDEETETMIVPNPERPIPPPKLTTQEVDDLYVQNVTERKVIDEEERIRRNTTEQYNRKRPAPLPPDWNVAIRTHPPAALPPRSPSATTVSTMPDWNVQIRQYPPAYEPRTPSESTVWDEPQPEFDVKIRQYPPAYEPRTPSESTVWDDPEPRPDFDVKIRQYPPIYQPRSPSESTVWDDPEPQPQPDFDVKIRQYPPVYEPRSPSESTVWDDRSSVPESAPPPDFNVKIRQYPPVYEPRSPSESTVWDDRSSVPDQQQPPDFNVKIRQYPPIYEPRSPSESTVWDDRSTVAEPRPDFNVNIRQYPPVYEPRSPSESTVWDDRSSVPESRHPPDFDVKVRQYPPVYEPREPSESTVWSHPEEERDPEFDVKIRQYPPARPSRSPSGSSTTRSEHPPYWNVLIRVLNPPHQELPDDDTSSVLTIEDRQTWHRIITTESSLRTTLTEAVIHEDWERIRRDTRFQRIFEPRKWEVIIRILAAPPVYPRDNASSSSSSSSSSSNSEPRSSSDRRRSSRGSSLTPVHEIEPAYQPVRRDSDDWSHSSGHTAPSSVYPRSTADRSMYSEMVDHPHRRAPLAEDWDRYSDDSGKISRRSLARSTTEITENWQRLPYDRVSSASENYSASSRPRRRPMLERSTTEVMEEVPHLEHRSSVSSSGSSDDFARRSRVPYERVSSSGSESESRRHQ